uniref:Uncharacterized protein n=1 Tax=Davidia involucrata TaxID=16924 RepID=A0A5B7BYR4_DAVIN
MLMHEDIFKQQVRELHRLYSAQKMLMDEMKNGIKQDRYWGPMTASDINHSHILEQHQPTNTTGYNLHFQSVRDSPRSREQQSVSCSGEFSRTPKGFDLETLAKEDIATGISKTSVDECDEESDVELTLSIGCSSGQKRSKSHQPHCSPDLSCTALTHSKFRELGSSALSKSEEDNTMGSSSASLNQQSKQPHWLFQGLTLNRT